MNEPSKEGKRHLATRVIHGGQSPDPAPAR
jgi:hypothetical protein